LRPESKPEFGFFVLNNETQFHNSALIATGIRTQWSLNRDAQLFPFPIRLCTGTCPKFCCHVAVAESELIAGKPQPQSLKSHIYVVHPYMVNSGLW
jgi:hypothetical protein